MGRRPRKLVPVLFAVLFLVGTVSPLLDFGRGETQGQFTEEVPVDQAEPFGEYIFGPISGQRYLIVKDIFAGTVEYVGNGVVFHDIISLAEYELSLAENSRYKIDPDLVDLLDDERSQNDIVSVIVDMRFQPSHEISLRTREKHKASLQSMLDERGGIYSVARSRTEGEAITVQKPLESYLSASEISSLEEINFEIDYKMFEIRKEIMDISMEENALSQEDLVRDLVSMGFSVGYQGHLLNTLSARVPVRYLESIADRDDVAFVYGNYKMYPLLDHSINSIFADVMWSNGYTGGPWDLTVADTGINKSHPNLHVEWEKVVHDNGQGDGLYDDDPASTADFHGHGTHIAGIVLSNDSTYTGVAYEMRDMINAKFGYQTTNLIGGGDWGDCMKVFDWAIQTAGADVISFSFGGPGPTNGNWGPSRYMDAVIDDLGVPIAISAGNEGMAGVTIPGDSFNAVTVGSMNDKNTDSRADDTVSIFSSRGPLDDGRVKPDVVAPGDLIRSANNDWAIGNDFVSMSGTSMASPHVAASILLMMNYTNDSSLFPAVYKAIMINQADDWGLPGLDNATGWGYIDMDDTLTYMDYHIEGFLNSSVPYRFYRGSIAVDDKATLVWQRHATYFAGIFPPIGTYFPPSDLGLYYYEMPSRNYLRASDFGLSNVEQLEFTTARADVLFKVKVTGAIQGVWDEPYSLALMSNFIEILPPSYIVNLTAPTDVMFGSTFFVSANVTNVGDLDGQSVSANLNLPPGLSLVSGANPASIGNLANGETQMAIWELSADAVGPQAISANGYSSSLGETFQNSSGPHVVTVHDVELPLIQDVTALPSPQEIYETVNISAKIIDNTGIDLVRVEIRNPDTSLFGNFTMAYHTVATRYYYYDTYPDLGDYTFKIWARDNSMNWNSSGGGFTIEDTISPEFRNLAAQPDPQEVFGQVNVTVDVEDNLLLSGVWIEITDPLASSSNYSMSNSFVDTYYHNSNYDILGTYDFVISAVDSELNWNATSGQFVIQDTTRPTAHAGNDQFDVIIETIVIFDGSLSSDNYQIDSYIWTFLDGNPQSLTGVSPQYIFSNASCYDITLNVTDTAGNYDTDDVQVCTVERNPPLIENVTATPNPQEMFSFVNVTANIWDDYGIVSVRIKVIDPNMNPTNTTMQKGPGTLYLYDRFYFELGTYTFTIWVQDVYGNWNSSTGSFLIRDSTPPNLNGVSANPSPQEIHGDVEVTVFVTDNHLVDQVVINITYPDFSYVNASMVFTGIEHSYETSYSLLGDYTFIIWANDASGNWNSSVGMFTIWDTTRPSLTVSANPDPQEVFYDVNISVNATDNHMIAEVWVNISLRFGSSVGNYSMLPGSGADEYYYLRSFDTLGMYDCAVWASDPTGNWNSNGHSFEIEDWTNPIITPLLSNPQVEVYTEINITANATDNYQMVGAWIIVYSPSGVPISNDSMSENPGDQANYYYFGNFSKLGMFTYILAARDSSMNWGASSESVTVIDTTPPNADAGNDRTILEGTPVTFDGGGSDDNYEDGIDNYSWAFTYDSGTVDLYGKNPQFTFNNPGNYSVTLVVTDSSGNQNQDEMWVNVTVKDTDNDGLPDDDEIANGTNPFDPDTDHDGLDDGGELDAGTDPLDPDTDGDGILDGEDEFPLIPEPGDPIEGSFLEKYWWLILLIVLIPIIVIPIAAASGRKAKKEEQERLEERKRRQQAALRAQLAAQRARMTAPPPPPPVAVVPAGTEEPPPPEPDEPPPPEPEEPPPPPEDDEPPPPPPD